ncbi:hypothetical protein IPM19_01685 [bacterium]|nr:MAG: hypothetical protein IPM19_01685 [bacterium]
MRITHHTLATRSFIIIVLLTMFAVYTAFVLARIQNRNSAADQRDIASQSDKGEKIDSTNWQVYTDNAYPLRISYPETWFYSADRTTIPEVYTINLAPEKDAPPIRIYISKENFVAVDNLKGSPVRIAMGQIATNYDDLVYAIKVGDNYYTFDGTMNEQYKAELAEIVRTARFDL